LRVIAGKYKGRRLNSPPSLETRPTSDRLRETLFNVIAARVPGARFLDLCAGSGAVGVEALSRGASHATFVDRSRAMRALISSNLALCRIPDKESVLITADALDFLRQAVKSGSEGWDVIFYDPPYSEDYESILKALGGFALPLMTEHGLLIIEHHLKSELPAEMGSLHRYRLLKQGAPALSFYSHK
jgi:16S rRNA (guanine966-N2)-methyltransferase